MIENFEYKNFELVRHYISTDIQETYKSLSKRFSSTSFDTMCTIFAAPSSALMAHITNNTYKLQNSILGIFLIFLLYGIYFLVFYWVYSRCYRLKEKYQRARKTDGDLDWIDSKKRIDDFDHIACDCVLIALQHKSYYDSNAEKYKKSNDEDIKQLQSFNFFEILYYIRKSVEITYGIIIGQPTKCIKSSSNADGVDIFRIYNLVLLMKEMSKFLQENCDEVAMTTKLTELNPSLKEQIDDVGKDIDDVINKCEEYIKSPNCSTEIEEH